MLAFLGPVQMVVVAAILLLVFGPDKLPEVGKQLGKAMRELMKAKQEFMDSMNFDDDDRHNNRYNTNQYNDYKTDYNTEYNNNTTYNGYDGYNYNAPEEKSWKPTLPESNPAQGDFAASAFVDDPYATPPATKQTTTEKNGNTASEIGRAHV